MAQTRDRSFDQHFARPQSWLEQNFRHAPPQPPGPAVPQDPVMQQLLEIQSTTLAILRKANFAGDYEAALAAAWQAVNNTQMIEAKRQQMAAEKNRAEQKP